jgi:hypothetical protein
MAQTFGEKRRASSFDLDQDSGDVVFAPPFVGERDEAGDRALGAELDDRRDVSRLEVPVQAIATKEKAISPLQSDKPGVDLHVVAVAHGASDDVPVG